MRLWLLAVTGAVAAGAAIMPLEEASARTPPDYSAAALGRTVTVSGTVAYPAIHFAEYCQLGIQTEKSGLMLESPSPRVLSEFGPGDVVEASGTIGMHAGLPVLRVARITRTGHTDAPAVRSIRLEELYSFRYLGQYISVEGAVIEAGDNAGGGYLLIGTQRRYYKIFIPVSAQRPAVSLAGFSVGDVVRASGLGSQYCVTPPYSRWFQVVARQPQDVVVVRRASVIHPTTLVLLALGLCAVVSIWWLRELRLRSQRAMLRNLYTLAEGVLGATSSAEIVKRVQAAAPRMFRATQARLYLFRRGAKLLDSWGHLTGVPLDHPQPGRQTAIATCFQNRTLLAIPDAARSPFGRSQNSPRALLLVPMPAQGEMTGVLEISHDTRARSFSRDHQALAQHLGNQIGLALRLIEQRSIREQLFRTEKLAAVGRLVSDVVKELQVSLSAMTASAEAALAGAAQPIAARDVRAIAGEARRASAIVERLISFACEDQTEARPVELNRLVRNLVEFREREWKARGIQVREALHDTPVCVLGSQAQLEQALLNLFVHCEQALADVPEKILMVRTGLPADKATIELSYDGSGSRGGPFSGRAEPQLESLDLGLCRTLIAGHGGQLRYGSTPGGSARFEVELPAAQDQAHIFTESGAKQPENRTALLMEPDKAAARQLLGLFSARGFRVVPASSAETGLELSQRVRFDVVLCSVHVPGLNWVELAERMQQRTPAFVLLCDGYDPVVAANFRGPGRFVLPKPIEEKQIERILSGNAGARAAAAR